MQRENKSYRVCVAFHAFETQNQRHTCLSWKFIKKFRPITSVASVHPFSNSITGSDVTRSDVHFIVTGSDVNASYKLKEEKEEGRRRRRKRGRGREEEKGRMGRRGRRKQEEREGGGREEGGLRWWFPSSTVAL